MSLAGPIRHIIAGFGLKIQRPRPLPLRRLRTQFKEIDLMSPSRIGLFCPARHIFVAGLVLGLASLAPAAVAQTAGIEVWHHDGDLDRAVAADSTECALIANQIAAAAGGAPSRKASEFAGCMEREGWSRRLRVPTSCDAVSVSRVGSRVTGDSAEVARLFAEMSGTLARRFIISPEARVRPQVAVRAEVVVSGDRVFISVYPDDTLDPELASAVYKAAGPFTLSNPRGRASRGRYDAVAVFRPECVSLIRPSMMESSVGGQTYFSFQVEKEVQAIAGTQQVPFPEALRATKVSGEVAAQFIVDTLGRVEIGSFKVLRTTNDLFVAAVRSHLPRMRFYPAEVNGRKVRQLVQQAFVFNLH